MLISIVINVVLSHMGRPSGDTYGHIIKSVFWNTIKRVLAEIESFSKDEITFGPNEVLVIEHLITTKSTLYLPIVYCSLGPWKIIRHRC